MDRSKDLRHWPHSENSRFVRNGTCDWHIQEMGQGPLVLLIHGAGASTHTWRDVMPLLAKHWRVVAIDLPGQGFSKTSAHHRNGLDGMCEGILQLARAEGWRPTALVGHSAGAAIALTLSRKFPDLPAVVGINAALANFGGVASWLYPLLARLLAFNPLFAPIFTFGGPNPARARRLLEGTGSHIDEQGVALYARLISNPSHVIGTLQMMTHWKVDPLRNELERIQSPTLLMTGAKDAAVPPEVSAEAASRMPNATVVVLPGLGHLCHEEDPDRTVGLIEEFFGSACTKESDCPEQTG